MLTKAQERMIALLDARPNPDPEPPVVEVTLEELAARVEALENLTGRPGP